jgi:hypothetical protein
LDRSRDQAIEPGDKAAIAAAVDESSDEAVYRRFLNPHGRLTAAELRYLTEVDHRDHEALLAFPLGSSKSVGVARYVRDPERRESAEIAPNEHDRPVQGPHDHDRPAH